VGVTVESRRLTRLHVPAIATGQMMAAGCCPVPAAAAAVQILMFVDGVTDVAVDEKSGVLTIEHDESIAPAEELAAELSFVGLPAEAV
jgi:hypothetical protein